MEGKLAWKTNGASPVMDGTTGVSPVMHGTIYFHINNNLQLLYLIPYYILYNMFMCPDKL